MPHLAAPTNGHARGLQQGKGAADIGADKITRAMDGTIHMAFSGKIDDGYRLILGDQGIDAGAIGNITLHEGKARFILTASGFPGDRHRSMHPALLHASIGHMGKPFAQ